MMLNVVANDNAQLKIDDVNNVSNDEIVIHNYTDLVNNINNKKRVIQRQLNEIKERIENRQDIGYGLVKDIDQLNYIENLKDYSYKENITTRIEIPYNLMLNFHKSIELKHGHNYPMSNTIITLVTNFNESFLGKQQHPTSSFLKYKNKEPRLDVLKKLKRIVDLLYDSNLDGLVERFLIKQAINEELNADPRTHDHYFVCIEDFIQKMMNDKLEYYSVRNLRGLREVIGEKLQLRDNEQNNLGREKG